MKAIILAAGYATRMHPLTENQPKALLPLGGRTVIDFIIDHINSLPEVEEIIVVSNHKFYTHFEKWAKTVKSSVPVSVLNDGSTSDADKIGSIGDIYFGVTQKNIEDDVLIIAGDNYLDYPLIEQYNYFKEKQNSVVCVLQMDDVDKLKQFAVAILDADNKITDLEEKPQSPQSDIGVFATYFLTKESVNLLHSYVAEKQPMDPMGRLIEWLYKKVDFYAYVMNGNCYDLGTIDAYEDMKKKKGDK